MMDELGFSLLSILLLPQRKGEAFFLWLR